MQFRTTQTSSITRLTGRVGRKLGLGACVVIMAFGLGLLPFSDSTFAQEISVALDIKPTSCPNPLNVKSSGVLSVAILGAEDFDVTQIDPGSILLEGVPPLRWNLEDVATPFEPFSGKADCLLDCTTEGLMAFWISP